MNEQVYEEVERALQLIEQRQVNEALDVAAAVLKDNPGCSEAIYTMGLCAFNFEDFGAAIRLAEEAARIDPNRREYAEALAFMMTRVGRLADAIYYAKLAIALEPHDYIIDLLPRGMSSFRHALETASYSAHYFRAAKSEAESNPDEAIRSARLELGSDPTHLEGNLVLIRSLMVRRRFGEALEQLHSIIAVNPKHVQLRILLTQCLQALGRGDEADVAITEAMRLAGDDAGLSMELMGLAAAQPDVRTFQKVQDTFLTNVGTPSLPYVSKGSQTRELVVGVLANTLSAGPLMSFLLPFMRVKDPGHLVIFYGQGRAEDIQSQWLRHEAYRWQETFDLDDATLARLCSNDEIDVLIDVTGLNRNARLPLLAAKPAPLTVRWLGFPNADGALGNEYLISGPMTHDVDRAVHDKCILLNRTLAPYELIQEQTLNADLTQSPANVVGSVTFGGVFDLARITPQTAALWARALHAVPGSRLLLGYTTTPDQQVRDACLLRFANLGVAERVLLQETDAAAEDRVAFFAMIDVFLDTTPVSQMVEVAEALSFGVPVVTLAGDRRMGRMAASIAHAANRRDMIAHTEDEFVGIAVGLTRNFDRLADLRNSLPVDVRQTPLYDAAGFVEELMGGLRTLLKR
jgi:predicted O-linked N-acetylglucosamine transferase (SPINDLY family)